MFLVSFLSTQHAALVVADNPTELRSRIDDLIANAPIERIAPAAGNSGAATVVSIPDGLARYLITPLNTVVPYELLRQELADACELLLRQASLADWKPS